MNSRPVSFEVATVNGAWSWRCLRDDCGQTRNGLRFHAFATSMSEHVAERHSTSHSRPRTDP